MAVPERLTPLDPPYALPTLFDTRGYKSLSGLVSRGVQAIEPNAQRFTQTHQLICWRPDNLHPYDTRNSGNNYAYTSALAERLRFKPQYDALVTSIHQLAYWIILIKDSLVHWDTYPSSRQQLLHIWFSSFTGQDQS